MHAFTRFMEVSMLRRAWTIFGISCSSILVFVIVVWAYLHMDDPHFINYAAALIPGVFSFFFGFVPNVRERHIAWRIGILTLGIAWSAVLWRQQVITEREQEKSINVAVNTAVDRSEKHSDQQTGVVRNQIDGVPGD